MEPVATEPVATEPGAVDGVAGALNGESGIAGLDATPILEPPMLPMPDVVMLPTPDDDMVPAPDVPILPMPDVVMLPTPDADAPAPMTNPLPAGRPASDDPGAALGVPDDWVRPRAPPATITGAGTPITMTELGTPE